MQHLITLKNTSKEEILDLLKLAQQFKEKRAHEITQLDWLKDHTLVNLFFEPSTRTRISFELAGRRLGTHVIPFDNNFSATQKGESIEDTVHTLTAMGITGMIVRHKENGIPKYLTTLVSENVHIINAGDGTQNHPTQALLDVLTIQPHKPDFTKLKIAILGDVLHSRVAHSDIQALSTLGVAEIRVIAPENLHPNNPEQLGVNLYTDIKKGLQDVDVVIALRVQRERLVSDFALDLEAFHAHYALTEKTLAYAKPDAIFMHPGPVNRGIEITDALMQHPRNKILEQVNNGIAMRMAVLARLLCPERND